MKPYAYLYIVGRKDPFEITEKAYTGILKGLNSAKYIRLEDGSVIMTASIVSIERDKRSTATQKYERWGLPPKAQEFVPSIEEPEQTAEQIEAENKKRSEYAAKLRSGLVEKGVICKKSY